VIGGRGEAVVSDLTRHIAIPTIGIGASADCDGQILVIDDMIGMTVDRVPKFVKEYAHLRDVVSDAAARFAAEVRDRTFPGPDHVFAATPDKDNV
ncbi:3-methyl-2-oxobutanoate hydroxymethyltransferase, partial [Mesorhizobium sp. M1E.F.Ca.ET.063.01.1.1]|uniref:3-methyl-2-oxobutanoate hydroxymethyltransferase n=1 Tax=Mesorhizobium sp. M1E.F.Ca.ET.063.01.1.1 TaxID=2496750 RepID=UPI000FD2FDC6